MRNGFIALLLGLFTTAAFAGQPRPQAWFVKDVSENGSVIVERFQMSRDGWQDKVGTFYFVSEPAAQAFMDRFTDVPIFENGNGPTVMGSPREQVGSSPRADNELWHAENKWSLEWEKKFSQWTLTLTPDFWNKNGIATDCADVAISLRWIFARMNKLEMANRLSGSSNFMTHRSLRDSWRNLPTAADWSQDKRFKAALNYLLDNTYTHSLTADSYAVTVTPEAVQPGSAYYMVVHGSSGHVQIVWRTFYGQNGVLPFNIIQSTVPRKVRNLNVIGLWYRDQQAEGTGGMLRMRWPSFNAAGGVSLVPSAEMPFYSREQFASNFRRTPQTPNNLEIYWRLNSSLSPTVLAREGFQSLISVFADRIPIVEQGYAYCHTRGCANGSGDYDAWSTPSRDLRIGELIQTLDYLREQGSTAVLPDHDYEIAGRTVRLDALVNIWKQKSFSSNPNAPIASRWGL